MTSRCGGPDTNSEMGSCREAFHATAQKGFTTASTFSKATAFKWGGENQIVGRNNIQIQS